MGILSTPLRGDEFDGGRGIDGSNGERRLVDILQELDAHTVVMAKMFSVTAAAKSATNVHAAVQEGAANQFPGPFTNPDVPRNLRVTFGASWDGGNVVVSGTNQHDVFQTETFVANPGNVVVGTKIFKTVTSATKAAVAGTTDTASIGTGDKLGITADIADAVGFLWVGTTAEAVTIDPATDAFTPTTVPAATTYKLLANVTQ